MAGASDYNFSSHVGEAYLSCASAAAAWRTLAKSDDGRADGQRAVASDWLAPSGMGTPCTLPWWSNPWRVRR